MVFTKSRPDNVKGHKINKMKGKVLAVNNRGVKSGIKFQEPHFMKGKPQYLTICPAIKTPEVEKDIYR